MILHWEYLGPLLVVCLISLTGTGPMIRTAATLLANWFVGSAYVYATGIPDAWYFSLLLDTISAAIILHQPAGKVQALIGATFMGQILLHGVYAFSNHVLGANPYWQMLTAMAFVQLLLLGGWTIAPGLRSLWKRRNPRLANAASTTGLGAW